MINLTNVRLNPTHDGVAYRIAKAPALLDLVPDDDLAPLVVAHDAALKAAREAAALKLETADDVSAEVASDVRAGVVVEPADVMTRLADAQTAEAQRASTVRLFSTIQEGLRDDISAILADAEHDLWPALAGQLDDVLDRADEIVSALGDVDSAEAAIDAGKAAEWASLKEIVSDYERIRAGHVALFRSRDSMIGNRDDQMAYAFFRSPVLPSRDRGMLTGAAAEHAPTGSTFDPWDTGSIAHLLFVARHRDDLRPYIGTPEDAAQARAGVVVEPVGTPLDLPRVSPEDSDPRAWRRLRG